MTFDVKDNSDHPFILNELIGSIDNLKVAIDNNSRDMREIINGFDARILALEKHKDAQETIKQFKTPIYSNWYNIAKITGVIFSLLFAAGVYVTSNRLISSEINYREAAKQIEINNLYEKSYLKNKKN